MSHADFDSDGGGDGGRADRDGHHLAGSKVHNVLTLPLLAAGLVYGGVTGGWSGLAAGLSSAGLAFLCLLIPYVLGGMVRDTFNWRRAVPGWRLYAVDRFGHRTVGQCGVLAGRVADAWPAAGRLDHVPGGLFRLSDVDEAGGKRAPDGSDAGRPSPPGPVQCDGRRRRVDGRGLAECSRDLVLGSVSFIRIPRTCARGDFAAFLPGAV